MGEVLPQVVDVPVNWLSGITALEAHKVCPVVLVTRIEFRLEFEKVQIGRLDNFDLFLLILNAGF